MNKVILIGRLGGEPVIKDTTGGVKVASFSLATDDSYKDKDGNKVQRTDWHNIVFFGKQAEICENYLTKGSLVSIEGKIKTESYDKDGNTVYVTKIHGQSLGMLGSKNDQQSKDVEIKSPVNQEATDDLPF